MRRLDDARRRGLFLMVVLAGCGARSALTDGLAARGLVDGGFEARVDAQVV